MRRWLNIGGKPARRGCVRRSWSIMRLFHYARTINLTNTTAPRRRALLHGILLGCALTCLTSVCLTGVLLLLVTKGAGVHKVGEVLRYRGGLYVGVLTAGRSSGRVDGIATSWGRAVTNVTYYTMEQSMDEAPGLPSHLDVVRVRSDPQHFRPDGYPNVLDVIRNVCTLPEATVQKYDWFLTLRDDIYVNVRQLASLISNLQKAHTNQIHAGLVSNKTLQRPGLTICTSSPAMLLSRPLVQGTCALVNRCEADIHVYGEARAFSSCVYHYLALQCTALPQEAFHNAQHEQLQDLFHVDPTEHVTDLTKRLQQVAFLQGVPQSWMFHKLNTLSTTAKLAAQKQVLARLVESREELEINVYGSSSTSLSTLAHVLHTAEGQSVSSQTCSGLTTLPPWPRRVLEESAYIVQAVHPQQPQPPLANSQFLQVYTSITNRTRKTSIIDIVSILQDNTATISRLNVQLHPAAPRHLASETFNKLDQLWVLLPVSNITEILLYLRFWKKLRQTRTTSGLTLVVLPINLDKAQLSNAIHKEGIYNSHGELRKVTILTQEELSIPEGATAAGISHACRGRSEAGVLVTSSGYRFNARFVERCLSMASTGREYTPIGTLEEDLQGVLPVGQDEESEQWGEGAGARTEHIWMENVERTVRCFSTKYCSSLQSRGRVKDRASPPVLAALDPDLLWVSTKQQHQYTP